MAYRLALAVGEWNVEDPGGLMERMSARQLAGWQAFAEVDGPFWQYRDDARAASVAATVANVNRAKGQEALSIEDCILKWGEDAEAVGRSGVKSIEEQQEFLKALTLAMGGEVKG